MCANVTPAVVQNGHYSRRWGSSTITRRTEILWLAQFRPLAVIAANNEIQPQPNSLMYVALAMIALIFFSDIPIIAGTVQALVQTL